MKHEHSKRVPSKPCLDQQETKQRKRENPNKNGAAPENSLTEPRTVLTRSYSSPPHSQIALLFGLRLLKDGSAMLLDICCLTYGMTPRLAVTSHIFVCIFSYFLPFESFVSLLGVSAGFFAPGKSAGFLSLVWSSFVGVFFMSDDVVCSSAFLLCV